MRYPKHDLAVQICRILDDAEVMHDVTTSSEEQRITEIAGRTLQACADKPYRISRILDVLSEAVDDRPELDDSDSDDPVVDPNHPATILENAAQRIRLLDT